MKRRAVPERIECSSSIILEEELAAVRDDLSLTESDETWDTIAHAIQRLASLARGNVQTHGQQLVGAIRTMSRPLTAAILSERSRLSGVAIDFVSALSDILSDQFPSLIPLLFPTLLTLCARSNKVFITRAKACVITVIQSTRSATILAYLLEAMKDKAASLRLAAAEGTLACLNCFNPPDFEKEPRAREVEGIIRAAARDANADVRKVGRQIFEAYKVLLPSRVDSFSAPLTPTIKKYLNIASKTTSGSQSNPSSRPQSAQSMRSTQRVSRQDSQTERPAEAVSSERSRKARGDMPPPAIVPVRPPSAGPQRIGAPSPDLPNPSDPRGPSTIKRPLTTRAAASTSHREGPTRPARAEATATAGPTRPITQKELPASSSGPIRPLARPTSAREDSGDRRDRVMGGARRVLLPIPSAPAAQAEEMTSTHSMAPSMSELSTQSTPRTDRTTTKEADVKTRQPASPPSSKPGVSKAQEKAVPVPATNSREQPKAATSTRERAAPSTAQAASSKQASSRSVGRTGDATRATSQSTARAKAISTREQSKDSKSTRGRPPPAQPVPTSKREAKPSVTIRQKPSKASHQEKLPAEVPLPPSPVAEASVPLPPSPQVQAQEVAKPIEPEHTAAPDDATPTRPTYLVPESPCDDPETPRANALQKLGQQFAVEQTPISSLVADIQRGFLFTPGKPLPPLESYMEPVPEIPFSNHTRPLVRKVNRDHHPQPPAIACTKPPGVQEDKPKREVCRELDPNR